MAIIKDYITPNGVHVRVHDDLAAKPGTPEAAAVIRGACRVAKQILMDAVRGEEVKANAEENGAAHGEDTLPVLPMPRRR